MIDFYPSSFILILTILFRVITTIFTMNISILSVATVDFLYFSNLEHNNEHEQSIPKELINSILLHEELIKREDIHCHHSNEIRCSKRKLMILREENPWEIYYEYREEHLMCSFSNYDRE